jgi:TolB-like protein/DNA-binding winged helix-turn-helix (wHTH) protein/Tfp pilus assembly protein PilF
MPEYQSLSYTVPSYLPQAVPMLRAGLMSLENPISNIFSFGVFHLDAQKGELRRLGTVLRLSPQPLRLLVMLASRHGEIVTRDEIQQALWGPETFVDFERGLNHCIRQIRAVLGDDAGAPSYIETIPRIGYRFIAPVSIVSPEPEGTQSSLSAIDNLRQPATNKGADTLQTKNRRRWLFFAGFSGVVLVLVLIAIFNLVHLKHESRLVAPNPRLMLAVMPFENLTGDPNQDYLSDGVTDELIVHLCRLSPSHLGIIARTSAMSYKHSGKLPTQISSELGVKYLLEGTVKRSGKTIRITAHLVKPDDQTDLWADTYDGEIDAERILEFQQSVAKRVAQSLSLVLPEVRTPHSATASRPAFEAFLKGRHEWNKRNEEGFHKSIEYFKDALAEDSRYAEAWAGLADSYNLSREYYEGHLNNVPADSGKEAALKALALDPNLSEAHASLAFSLWHYEWNYTEAEAEFQKALNLGPNNAIAHHWYGIFLASRGRFNEARSQLHEAETLDPLSLIVITNSGWVNYYARDYDAAIRDYQEALKLDSGFQSAQMKLAWAFEQKAMWPQALDTRRKFYLTSGHPEIALKLGNAFAQSGYPGVLNTIISETEKPDAGSYYSDYERAKLYAMAGNSDKAVALLQRAYAGQSGWLVYLAVEPAFDKLRSNPGFARLVSQTSGGYSH